MSLKCIISKIRADLPIFADHLAYESQFLYFLQPLNERLAAELYTHAITTLVDFVLFMNEQIFLNFSNPLCDTAEQMVQQIYQWTLCFFSCFFFVFLQYSANKQK